MFKTAVEKQKLCVKTANKYRGACKLVSSNGPDLCDVVRATWCDIAINSLLAGCEMVPFTETTIKKIESSQADVAKFALGLPSNAPNLCAQSEFGLKYFRQVLYERQLMYYNRLIKMDSKRWAHQAVKDHLSGDWESPYLNYIASIRMKLGIVSLSDPIDIKKSVNSYFVQKFNTERVNFGCLLPVEKFSKQPYVCESDLSTVIAGGPRTW